MSKSFPDNSDGRGNGMPLWPAQSKKLELQSNEPQSFDSRTALFGQDTVETLKDMLLNGIILEKNCTTSVTKLPGVSCEDKINEVIPQHCKRQTHGCSSMCVLVLMGNRANPLYVHLPNLLSRSKKSLVKICLNLPKVTNEVKSGPRMWL